MSAAVKERGSLVDSSRLLNESSLKERFSNMIIQWEVILVLMFVFEIVLFSNLTPYFLNYFNIIN